jgi:hypothetical protein
MDTSSTEDAAAMGESGLPPAASSLLDDDDEGEWVREGVKTSDPSTLSSSSSSSPLKASAAANESGAATPTGDAANAQRSQGADDEAPRAADQQVKPQEEVIADSRAEPRPSSTPVSGSPGTLRKVRSVLPSPSIDVCSHPYTHTHTHTHTHTLRDAHARTSLPIGLPPARAVALAAWMQRAPYCFS